jgi:hypothetical protein
MNRFLLSWVCVLSVLTLVVAASTHVSTEGSLSLSVRVRSRHVSHFEACVPVQVNEPFRIVWGSETVKEVVSGIVKAPIKDEYSTKLSISEGNGQCQTEIEPKLKLDTPDELSNLVSATFNHIDAYRFVLSKKPCE